MKAILAWYFISLSHGTREMYALLSDMCGARAFNGTNPARTLLDGVLLTIVGVLVFFIPIVGLVLLPIGIPAAMIWYRADWKLVSQLAADGRVDWKTGRVTEEEKAENVPEEK